MSEKVFVESLDKAYEHGFGILIYKIIAEHVLSDLALGRFVQQMRILIDIKKPIFAVSVTLSASPPPIKMKDYARLEKRADGIHVTIHDETYATDLLKMLWDKFGKDKVTQIDRWESVIPSDFVTLEELQEMVIAEPGKRMMESVLDAVVRIIPEGFRIGHLRYENGLTVIASENPVQEDWVRIVRAALAKPPKPLPPKELEKVKRKLKEEAPPEFREGVKPWKTPFTEVERR